MLELLKNTVEYRELGFNATTVGALGLIFFAFLEGWALWSQNKKIWHGHSGRSVSFYRAVYSASFTTTSIVYGFYLSSISIIFNRLVVAVLNIPIIVGLVKFKRIGLNEKIQSGLFTLMIPAMALFSRKDEMYILFSAGIIYALGTQIWELYKEKSPGTLDIRLIVVYIISNLFWITYGFSVGAVGLMVLNPSALMMLVIIALLWLKYWLSLRVRA